MFNGKLPMDFCTLFWNTLFSVVLLPFTIIAAFPLWKSDCFDDRILFGKWFNGTLLWLATLFFSVCGLGLLEKMQLHFWKDLWFIPAMILGLLTFLIFILSIIIAFVVVVILPIEGVKSTRDYYREKRWEKMNISPSQPKIVLLWGAIRKKYCTKIDWK
jgi:hypothetical protein